MYFDRIFTVSEAIQQSLLLSSPRSNVSYIGNAIDTSTFTWSDHSKREPLTLLTVGNLRWQKGHSVLIQSLKILVDEFPQLNLHIVGDGPLRDTLTSQISDLELEKNVYLLGRLSSQHISSLLRYLGCISTHRYQKAFPKPY